jgi:hypothetical protein
MSLQRGQISGKEIMPTTYDYHQDADILEVFFTDIEATAAVSLTQDIILHFQAEDGQAVSLIFNNFSVLSQPAEYGPYAFRLQMEQWPESLRPIVWRILTASPVTKWLEMTSYHPPRARHSIPLVTVKQSHGLAQVA